MKRTPMKRSNPARRAKMYARNFGPRAEVVRDMPCLVARAREATDLCRGRVQAAHVIARGMGGCGGDARSLVPLCARHHEQSGARGTMQRVDFETEHGIVLQVEADRIAAQLDSGQDGAPS